MEYIRFGELYGIPTSNGVSRPSAVRGQGFHMINMGELFAHNIIDEMPMERVLLSEKEQKKFLVQKGDLLFARQSLVAAGAGKCSFVNNIIEPTTFESHLIRVRLDKKRSDSKYYYYLFQLPYNPIKAIVNQCAQAGIRGSELQKVKVPYPSLPTQRRIASILSAYDNLIENNNKRIRLLEQMAENLYKEWFAYHRIKDSAKEIRLTEIVSYSRGLSYSSEEIDCEDGNDLINLKNIQAFGGFRLDGTKKYDGLYKEEQIVIEGDLIMGVTDMTQDRRTVGSVALIPNITNLSVISADLIKLKSDIDNVYLYAMFRWGNVSRYISQFANGANVLHLRPQVLKNIKVMLPQKTLIEKYVSTVRPMIETINKLNTENDLLSRQRDLLLPRLMSGKLEVKE